MSNHHSVTVTLDDRGDVDQVAFTCDALPDADCRRIPDCDCESWFWNDDETADQRGHVRVPGQPCWVASWFEAGPEVAVYSGDDQVITSLLVPQVPPVERSGLIDVTWCDGYVEWTWRGDHRDQVEQLDLSVEDAARELITGTAPSAGDGQAAVENPASEGFPGPGPSVEYYRFVHKHQHMGDAPGVYCHIPWSAVCQSEGVDLSRLCWFDDFATQPEATAAMDAHIRANTCDPGRDVPDVPHKSVSPRPPASTGP